MWRFDWHYGESDPDKSNIEVSDDLIVMDRSSHAVVLLVFASCGVFSYAQLIGKSY